MKPTITIRIDIPTEYEKRLANALSPRERLDALVRAAQEKIQNEKQADDR